jgi:aspartokinase/homoserine dehydrogenase 1
LIATGFIARTPDGIPTTLKRNGSDYSATIFGALLIASNISSGRTSTACTARTRGW